MRRDAQRVRAGAASKSVVQSPEDREAALKQAKQHEAAASKLLRDAETRVLDQAQVRLRANLGVCRGTRVEDRQAPAGCMDDECTCHGLQPQSGLPKLVAAQVVVATGVVDGASH